MSKIIDVQVEKGSYSEGSENQKDYYVATVTNDKGESATGYSGDGVWTNNGSAAEAIRKASDKLRD